MAHSSAAKEAEIKRLIMQNPVDCDHLRRLALSQGGLISNEIRMLIWPKLLSINRYEVADYTRYVSRNRWSEQIKRDVDRSMYQLDNLGRSKKRRRGGKRKLLADMINALMSKYPDLHYYQGLHDIVSVLVLILTDDEDLCFAIAERLASHYLMKDCMRENFTVLMAIIELLFPLLRHFDPHLTQFLEKSGVHSFFALSWIITFFAHDVHDLHVVARLFDAFIASCPLFPLYLSAALVLHWKKEIMNCECDFSVIHAFLSRLPTYGPDRCLPVESLIVKALSLQRAMPPARLIREGANKDLASMVAKGQIAAFQYPPGWYATSLAPDWWLMEEKRRQDGLPVRCKLTRNRRRRARMAGAKVSHLNNGRVYDASGRPLPLTGSKRDGSSSSKKEGGGGGQGLPGGSMPLTLIGVSVVAAFASLTYWGGLLPVSAEGLSDIGPLSKKVTQ